jgi:hypothetical protein
MLSEDSFPSLRHLEEDLPLCHVEPGLSFVKFVILSEDSFPGHFVTLRRIRSFVMLSED